jgi:glycosyltransferase involved in cell wall biosynthesis
MKTALIHYWMTAMRGGENVLAEICRLYPDADIFTHAWNREKVGVPFTSHKVTETFIAHLPGARKGCQKYLVFMPAALRRLDLSPYDLIISSESGPAKGIRKPSGAVHVCYCHTPMRYLWDMNELYYQAAGLGGKLAMKLFLRRLRDYDRRSADAVDHFIANSAFVAERIRRIYGRESTVIYPPVNVDFFRDPVRPGANDPKRDFYLCAGQVTPYKRVDIAVLACLKLGRRLVVAGDGPELKRVQQAAGGSPLISFEGRCTDERLRELFTNARALIFPGIEDFGIVPLEAQAAGTPVIAFGQGGALETVLPGRTGLFFREQTPDALAGAIEDFEAVPAWDPVVCSDHAQTFNQDRFRAEIDAFVRSVMKG